jgi:hypothetical protein
VFKGRKDDDGDLVCRRIPRGDVEVIWDCYSSTQWYFSPIQNEWDLCFQLDPDFHHYHITVNLTQDDDPMEGVYFEPTPEKPIPEAKAKDFEDNFLCSLGREIEGKPQAAEPLLDILKFCYGFIPPSTVTPLQMDDLECCAKLLVETDNPARLPTLFNAGILREFLEVLVWNNKKLLPDE